MPADSLQPTSAATAARTGSTLFILLNPRAGSSDQDQTRDTITALLDAANHPYEMHAPKPAEGLEQACRRVAGLAARHRGVLVAAGGDGTINTAVNAARSQGVMLGLLPLGTFNYLAREHGIPLELGEAVRALMAGAPRPVAMGEVNGRLFFNNASFGLYTTLIHEREAAKKRFGRHRIVAALALIGSLLRGRPPFEIQIVKDGKMARRRTSLVFVGANPFQLTRLGLAETAERKGDGLAVVVLKSTSWLQRIRLFLRAALKQLEEDGRLDAFCTHQFAVHSRRARIEVIVDGEALRLSQPLQFRTVPGAVELIVPDVAPQ